MDQPPASHGFAISVTKHVGDTFNRDPVKLATYEIMKSLATMNIHQNNTGMAHSFADGNETLAKRGASAPLSPYDVIDPGRRGEVFSIPIRVGEQPGSEELHVVLTTDFSDVFLLSSDCDGCGTRNKYNPALSNTHVPLEGKCELHLDDEHVMSGKTYSDNILVGGQTVRWYSFCLATEISPEPPMKILPTDGFFGLGIPLAPLKNSGNILVNSPSVFERLFNQKPPDKQIYGLTLADNVAEVFIGGISPKAGQVIAWIKAQRSGKGIWRVPCEKITVGKVNDEYTVVDGGLEVYLDMSQTTIVGTNVTGAGNLRRVAGSLGSDLGFDILGSDLGSVTFGSGLGFVTLRYDPPGQSGGDVLTTAGYNTRASSSAVPRYRRPASRYSSKSTSACAARTRRRVSRAVSTLPSTQEGF